MNSGRRAKKERKEAKKIAPSSSATVAQQKIEQYSGPIPPPDTLKKFDEIIPNGADRIMRLAENAQEDQRRESTQKFTNNLMGQIFAFLLCLMAFYVGIVAIQSGGFLAASGIVVTTIGAIVGAFLYDRHSK